MDNNIMRSERLYRAVIKNPDFWKPALNKPSSAVFKDSNGVSVDRGGERKEADSIDALVKIKNGDVRAVVKVMADFCFDLPTHVFSDPVENNEFHAQIHESEECVVLHKSKAKKLALVAETVAYFAPEK